MDVTQRNVTRNQSTADYVAKRIFLFDNRFVEGVFSNNSGSAYSLKHGELVARNTSSPFGFIPVTAANLADVIGVAKIDEGPVALATAGTTNINVGTKGTIDGGLLVLPSTVTLDTVVGNKTLRDVLETIGLHVDTSTVDNTKADN